MNRNTVLGRLLYIPAAFTYCGISWPWIGLKLHKGDKADKNELAKDWAGFADPRLVWDQKGSLAHRSIDFFVEWVRISEAQRTAKFLCFLGLSFTVFWFILAVAGWSLAIYLLV